MEENDVIVLKADKSGEAPDVDALLRKLGNQAKAIPYYAVFRPGKEPVHFNGVFLTPGSFLDRVGRENLTPPTESAEATSTGFNLIESEPLSGGKP